MSRPPPGSARSETSSTRGAASHIARLQKQKPRMSTFDLVAAAEALLADAKKLAAGASEDEDALRRKIGMAAKRIAVETPPPMDVIKGEWVAMADIAVWSLFLEWKAFDLIPLNGSISISDLAKGLNAEESLVSRLANFLVCVGKLLPGPEPNHVRHSRLSKLLISTAPTSPLCTVAIGNGFKSYARWPEYFEKYGRREPPDVRHTPFAFAWGHPELAPWEVKALYPEYATRFALSMKSRQIVGGDMSLVGPSALYDLGWIGHAAKKWPQGEPLVVDVGGGMGQLLKDVVTEIPSVQAEQCVLQDRKEVLEEAVASRDPVIERVSIMEHDFHTEQPVKGALVYFLRRILLDYPDAAAIGILRRLADALPADNPNARIVIMEEKLSEPPVPPNRIVDLMMVSLGGKLRNEKMMGELVSAAGLKMVKYYAKPGDPTCVVECAKA
ncbi:Demethylsterigmatocystin 6-O-methyltransferase [Echria macrotheca]|uniref:Demethylsterigmatocystin 6-O-methyltransferase n=1 Tax=Echria macrotheca TaxID=438768 RepID=A0AAJ0F983_9PEZI|nr:Demethylsterigmatocystin 6-O-methyltransferase [Echria macrotheca]